jgi:hypothetical protein
MRLLPDVYLDFDAVGSVPSVDDFGGHFSRVTLKDADFNKEVFIPGTGGETRLYSAFAIDMKLKKDPSSATQPFGLNSQSLLCLRQRLRDKDGHPQTASPNPIG